MRKLLIETSIENGSGIAPSLTESKYGQAGTDCPWYKHDDIDISAYYDYPDTYPFGENRVIREDYSDYNTYSEEYSDDNGYEAGTDFPYYYDEKRGKEFGGDWHSDAAYPFAYFEVAPGELGFFVGDGCTTHSHLAFNVAKDYYLPVATSDELMELANSVVVEINKLIEPAINGDKEKYNWLRNNLDEASDIVYNSSLISNYDIDDALITIKSDIRSDIRISLLNNVLRGQNDVKHLKKELYNRMLDECIGDDEDDVRVWWLDGLFKLTNLRDGDEYFENGRMEGRIFTIGKVISFYDEQQPNSEELDTIIKKLANEEKLNVTYDELMEYEIIYRNWDDTYVDEDGYDKGRVTGCSVYEYITGKPMDDFINPEERKGSQFIPHLASPEEKFNFFKNFRSARDRAIYVPREKGAGSLAAYHAMRYPYGENKNNKGRLLTEEYYNQAGTDFPSYYDEENDVWYEASWNGDFGFPFGYWPINPHGDMKFCIGQPYETHANACGIAAREYFFYYIDNMINETATEICDKVNDFIEEFKDGEFVYDEEKEKYVSEKYGEVKDEEEFFYEIYDNIYSYLDGLLDDPAEYIHQLVIDFLENGYSPDYDEIYNDMHEYCSDTYSFSCRDDIDEALEVVGSSFDDFFEEGHSEGRIWPYAEMIGFYETEQPSPSELEGILNDLINNVEDYIPRVSFTMDELMGYHMIYEDPDNDWETSLTTLDEYINGTHEEDKQYAKDGKTVFIPHLASPEEKFNFFKNFRSARDKAIYVPREKGAGSLAAYHAMRYPYGEDRDINGNLIREDIDYDRDNEAGTDCPYFFDIETGFVIEGDVDDDDACPFGYFRYKLGSTDLKFFCCYDCNGAGTSCIHRDIIESIIWDMTHDIENEIESHESEIITYLKQDFENNPPNKDDFPRLLADIFNDAGVNFTPSEEYANHLYKYLSEYNWTDRGMREGMFDEVLDRIYDYWNGEYVYVGNAFDISYNDMLYSGRLLGRIWENTGLITFYPGQQPSRDEMKMVITDISSKMNIEYDDLLNFHTIFEVGSKEAYTGTGYKQHSDADIQCCTVADYIEGKYSGFNRDEEIEMVKNRKGVSQLNIHLAKPEEKFNFFKNFRNTRDRVIYEPREKGAGSLAAYHALRHPFGEDRKRFLQIVSEEVDLLLEGNGTRAKRQTIAIIANRFGLDTDSPYVIDMENKFKTMFFNHGLDSDRYIVFEPNLCRCALELGFGSGTFSDKDKDYIANVFDLIYRHIEPIKDDKTRQAELKRIKDSITGIDALKNIDNELQAEFPVNNEPTEDKEEEEDKSIVNNLQNGYHREGPLDFKGAGEFGQHSNPGGRICYTYQPTNWNNYSKGGINTCYVLLRDGWEDVKPIHDGSEKECCLGEPFNKYNAYDNYGMSMIFIFTNPQGNLAFANGRWNHGADWPSGYRCDHEYTEDDIEKLIGQPFNKVFKTAYNFDKLLAEALEKLKNGMSLRDVFGNVEKCWYKNDEYKIGLCGLVNLFYKDKIVSPIWFDKIVGSNGFNELGLAGGIINGNTYIFDTEGKFYTFSEISQIINNKLANGEELGNVWGNSNSDGFRNVLVGGKVNIVSLKTNRIISPNVWFDSVTIGYGNRVITGRIGDTSYFLTEEGKIVSKEKYIKNIIENIEKYPGLREENYEVNPDVICIVVFGEKYFIRKKDGKLIFGNGYLNVHTQDNKRFIWMSDDNSWRKYVGDLETGNIMSQKEFFQFLCDLVENGENYFTSFVPAGDGIYKVGFTSKGQNYMKDGKLMFDRWFEKCGNFKNGIAKVQRSGINLINYNGQFLLDKEYGYVENYGNYAFCIDEDDNPYYGEYGDEEEYCDYGTLIDLETGKKIYDHKRIAEEGDISHTKFGEYYWTDDDEFCLVLTKNGQLMEEGDYGKLLSEDYKRNEDLSIFTEVKEISYGYKKVKAIYMCYNILDREDNLVLDDWAWYISDFKEGRLEVSNELGVFYLDENLNVMGNQIYRGGDSFDDGMAWVIANDGRYYFIDTNGKPLFNHNGFKHAYPFYGDKTKTTVRDDNDIEYYLYKDGRLEPIKK